MESVEEPELAMPGPRSSSGHGCLWLLIILALLAGGGYYAWQQNFWGLLEKQDGDAPVVSENLPTANDYMAKKDAEKRAAEQTELPVKQEEPKETPVSEPVSVQQAQSAPANEPEKSADVTLSEPSSKEGTAPATVQTPAQVSKPQEEIVEATVVAPAENHKLIITAIEECWVHSNSDKTDTRQFSLRKGDTFALTFADSLELKLGNAGGVRLRYDGRDMPPAGTSGQVRTIVFPPRENND